MRPIEFRNKLSFAITPEHHAHSCGGALHAPLLLLLGFAGAIAANPIYGAQDYPTRPVRVVVPFAAGGGSGAMAQIVTQKLTEALGQPAVMDYRSGAGGPDSHAEAYRSPRAAGGDGLPQRRGRPGGD